tara:strand:+ start:906 stop:1637 length:732 start_codon:yes stop_codon:yes gene_type:complete
MKKKINKFITTDLSDSIERSVESAVNADIDISELYEAVANEPVRVTPSNEVDENSLSELAELIKKGRAIPGQSLVNNPETPYNWEKPAKFANPREALKNISDELLEKEALQAVAFSLADGVSVEDLTSSILFAKFYKGDINPDTLLTLIQPIMYLVMSIGDEAGVNFNIEANDVNEIDEEDEEEKIKEFQSLVASSSKDIKNSKRTEGLNIQKGVLPESLLARVKEETPKIQSLLNKTNEIEA